jgi:transposase
MMVRRHELTDDEFARLRPLLPPGRPATGRPNRDHRTVLNAIFWRLRTGAPWRDLPERYGPWQTAYSRFRRWQRAGVWDRILAELQSGADARGEVDWALHVVDGTTVRAHPHAAGAPKKGAPTANRRTKPSAAPGAASRPSCTCAPRAAASRSASS